MYRMILVDDEPMIREGIRTLIRRMPGWELAGEAGEGNAAMSMIESEQPDLVLTDIRMPGMDGLRLLEEIRGSGYETVVVLLTGYPDFSYAQQAIHHGAFEYLLKPCSAAAITDMLHRVETQIEKKHSDKMAHDTYVAENTLRDLLYGSGLRTYLHETLPFFGKGRYLYVVSLAGESVEYPKVLERVNVSFHEWDHLLIPQGKHEFTLAVSLPASSEITLESLEAKLHGLRRDMENMHREHRWMAGIGNGTPMMEEPWKSYIQSKHAMNYASPKVPVLAYRRMYESVNKRVHVPLELEMQLLQAVIKGLTAQTMEVCEELNDYLLQMSLTDFIDFAFQFQMRIVKYWEGDAEAIEHLVDWSLIASKIRDLPRAVNEWRKQLTTLAGQFDKLSQVEGNAVVKRAVRAIEEHYATDITLATIANKFKMNASYLSVLFKQEAGCTFTDYLTQYRIEAARKLLAETNEKIYKIAQQVGYTNGRHFSQSFRKVTGMTPNEYRVRQGIDALNGEFQR